MDSATRDLLSSDGVYCVSPRLSSYALLSLQFESFKLAPLLLSPNYSSNSGFPGETPLAARRSSATELRLRGSATHIITY
eukprot:749805-Hanusia_phi.AAC.2